MTETKRPSSAFVAEVMPDAATGWQIAVLRFRDARHPSQSLEARIAPEAGANLFSFKVGALELLAQPDPLATLVHHHAGTPILFPTPNRVRDARMQFEGRPFVFEPNSRTHFIHGLARNGTWTLATPLRTNGKQAAAVLTLDWDPNQRDFFRFPIRHRLTVTFTLRRVGLHIAYRVENRDRTRLPYGFGLHPYFRVPGAARDVELQLPQSQRMETVDMLPTGKLLPVAGTAYDLRRPVPLDRLALDDVYFGRPLTKHPRFILKKEQLAVTFVASRAFRHVVVYTPGDRTAFCIENQTCSTDAHNLWDQGHHRPAHLLIVPPNKTSTGAVTWRIQHKRG